MSAIGAATNWFMALLAGPIVTTLLIIAVAAFGFALLFGRLSLRRGLEVVFGCFVLVGAADISESMLGNVPGETVPSLLAAPVSIDEGALPPLGPDPVPVRRSGNPFDPYAGTSSVN